MHEPGHQHASPIKNPKQLVVVVALAFIVPIVVIILLSQIVTDRPVDAGDDAAVLNRIKPVGDVVLAAPSGPKGQLTGEQVYGQVCKTCHATGLAGAPKVGDKTAWAKVIAHGQAMSVEHAIKGIRAMPPKGGNPDLENVEVERAVVFMANQTGANWKAPAVVATSAPATPPAPAVAPAPAAAATPVAAAAPAAAAGTGKADGKKIYETTCSVCHAAGIAGAPKFGDKAAWAPRLKTGVDALYASAIKGKAAMPAKGGNVSLPDADVKAAVDYMVAAGK